MTALQRMTRRGGGPVLASTLVFAGLFMVPLTVMAQEQPAVVDDAAVHDLDLMGSEVRQVQQALRDRGYFTGPADGRREERLRTALRDFQRAEGLPITGGLDKGTLVKLGLALPDEAEIVVPGVQPEPQVETQPQPVDVIPVDTPQPAEETPASEETEPLSTKSMTKSAKSSGSDRDVISVTKSGVSRARHAVVTAGSSVATAGKAAGEGVGTGGKAIGKAGTATAEAAKVSARATKVGALAVAHAPIALYSTGRRAIFGREADAQSSDDRIRKSLESRFAEDERIVPEEVEVQVAQGKVTLVFSQNPRTDVAYAGRLAKLTPGVVAVEATYK